MQRVRRDGIPVVGFIRYSLTDQIDWDTGLAGKNNHVNACGLYGLDWKPRPVAAAYKRLIQEFGRTPILPPGAMCQLTDLPAVAPRRESGRERPRASIGRYHDGGATADYAAVPAAADPAAPRPGARVTAPLAGPRVVQASSPRTTPTSMSDR